MTRVLAIDDEPAILRLLQVVLGRGGFEMIAAGDARLGLQALGRGGIDAVVLDLGLPDRDGLEVVPAIRAASNVPIVVLTARSDVAEKICALDLGADDYVTKPFDGDELLARLRSALRRGSAVTPQDRVAYGGIVVDVAEHRVTVDGKEASLTPREFDVLHTLTEAGGRILTHSALLERVWGKAHREDVEYLRVVIRALRLKIEADPSAPRLIRNEPGIGYRLDQPASA
jgi:two-component system KDP operon response regulator KdpE